MTLPTPLPAMITHPSRFQRLRVFWAGISRWNFVAGLMTSLVLGGGYYIVHAQSSGQTATSTSVTIVSRQTIVSSIQAAGKVTFASEQQMKFNQRGTVTKVNVQVGDKVKHGDVLAEIDNTSVLADIRSAQLALNGSYLQLQQYEADSQKTVNDAATSLAVAQQKLPSDIAAAKQAVEEKQAALDQAQLNLKKQQDTELQTLAETAQSIVASVEKVLDAVYGVLTRDTGARPQVTEYTTLTIDNLLYNDLGVKKDVEFAYFNAVNYAKDMRTTYGSLATERDPAVLLKAIDDAKTLAQAAFDLTDRTYVMLQGATTDPGTFSSSDLTTLRNTVSTNRTTAAGLISDADTAKANLLALHDKSAGLPSITLKDKEDAVTTAEHDLEQAQDNLKVVETQSAGDLTSQQQAFSNSNTDTTIQIRLKQNTVAQQQAALEKVRKSLEDYRLVAPFDGLITHIDYKVGDNLLDTGDTEFLTLQNPGTIVVTIPLDQVDVVHVKLGTSASITFDAIPGQQFQGTIEQIDSSPITTSGVVSYNVSVEIPAPEGLTILSGMTATVTIETARKENVLAVPNLAIQTTRGQQTVQRANGQTVTVETGITDGRMTEIISGLSEGDGILSINIPRSAGANSSANANQQLFRLGGGGGFGGGRPGG